LVRVRDFSGQLDDEQVEVDLYDAFGLLPRSDAGTDTDSSTPVDDGRDQWMIIPNTLVEAGASGASTVDNPRFIDRQAYVSRGKLVAHFADALVPSGLSLIPASLLPVNQLVLEGDLTLGSQDWELHRLDVAMRVPATIMLPFIARTNDAVKTNVPVCQIPDEYNAFKAGLCDYLDISSTSSDRSAPCDSLSMALRFDMVRALPAEVLAPASPIVGDEGSFAGVAPSSWQCAPGVHPETDTCP
jgi:hypothetical protein